MAKNILLIEDDLDIARVVRHSLEGAGYQVCQEINLENILKQIHISKPDLIILDLIIEDKDGFEVCRKLKRDPQMAHIPILILSSRDGEADIVAGLELGAEDYMTKPFSARVLLSRVRKIFGRSHALPSPSEIQPTVEYAGFRIDLERFEIKYEGTPLTVTRSEFRILQLLFARPGYVFSRKQILEAIHGEEKPVTVRSVDVMIVNLRHKLGKENEKLLETVRGMGYRAREHDEAFCLVS